jgi:hypothetical protein
MPVAPVSKDLRPDCSGRLNGARLWSACGGALAVARKHTLRRFQFAELARELFALRTDARQRLADPLRERALLAPQDYALAHSQHNPIAGRPRDVGLAPGATV